MCLNGFCIFSGPQGQFYKCLNAFEWFGARLPGHLGGPGGLGGAIVVSESVFSVLLLFLYVSSIFGCCQDQFSSVFVYFSFHFNDPQASRYNCFQCICMCFAFEIVASTSLITV